MKNQSEIAHSIALYLKSNQDYLQLLSDMYNIGDMAFMANMDTLGSGCDKPNATNVICLSVGEDPNSIDYAVAVEVIIKRKRSDARNFDITEIDGVTVDNTIIAMDLFLQFIHKKVKDYIQGGIIVGTDVLKGCQVVHTQNTRPLGENFDDIYGKVSFNFNQKKCQ